jgi:hypothetical protein
MLIPEPESATIELILARDLDNLNYDAYGRLISGTLTWDPYTGRTAHWQRSDNMPEVVVAQLVSVDDAWISGGHEWALTTWHRYMNDPGVLITVSAAGERAKAERNASSWLPCPKFRPRYIIEQIRIKSTYHLSIADSEHQAMGRILQHPDQAQE